MPAAAIKNLGKGKQESAIFLRYNGFHYGVIFKEGNRWYYHVLLDLNSDNFDFGPFSGFTGTKKEAKNRLNELMRKFVRL